MNSRLSQLQPVDDYPQICSETGLTCESCTKTTAQQLAAVCKGLAGRAIGQLFVQIYTNSACAPMHAHFAACYKEASLARPEPAPVRVPARREVMSARPRAMTAVA
jgi:hypothetical protein